MRILISLLTLIITATTTAGAQPPKLVVNIVVGQMRYDHLARFERNFGKGGFRRFNDRGVVFTNAWYNYMQTLTSAGLATITTGADPAVHGVVTDRWIDYTTGRLVGLIEDEHARGVGCSGAGVGEYSPQHIVVPTLGDRLLEYDSGSRVVSIASDPLSAIVMGGQHGTTFWLDDQRGCWMSSNAYMDRLPQWVTDYNNLRVAQGYLNYTWRPLLDKDRYVNTVYSAINVTPDSRLRRIAGSSRSGRNGIDRDYERLLFQPVGNTMVAEFAKHAIEHERLGQGAHTDMLYICFDTPRFIGQMYGPESMEMEDMFYRLDAEIALLLEFIGTKVDMNDVVVVLTAAHGISDSFDHGRAPRDRFNAAQFRMIVNAFMNAQYGEGDWVLDYIDRQLYLDRNLIFRSGLSLEEVQNRVASFALQFRGVSHVLTSTAMQSGYFGGSYAEKMQNSFYPRRGGDLTINLMPGWIEERTGVRAASGSMYAYDTHVPLMMLGPKFFGQRISRTVNMRDLAPTLAVMMQISRPVAAKGEAMEDIVRMY
ncbi:MAG: alkaline phosphatase family protein [Rikenellaceae bacterium]|nr:alkaline phosphatase family protein [Rikenellaceae bacterium]MCL2692926.1 alkaline phosphatase family protein [Rikenellaceae bacterium]